MEPNDAKRNSNILLVLSYSPMIRQAAKVQTEAASISGGFRFKLSLSSSLFIFKARQMENTALKNLLTSLCANSPWKYVVFWKLKHIYQMLTWEDCYFDYTKRKKSFKGNPGPACSSDSFGHQPCISDQSSTDFSIGFSIGYVSCLQYALGVGVIGRAALTGDDKWVAFQKSVSDEFCSLKTEFPEEWNLQVTAGIETILLVPVLPHGVLQFGSLDKVEEDPSIVSEIKDKFNSSLYKGNLLQSALPDNVVCSSSTRSVLVMDRDEANSWCTKLPSEMQFEESEVVSTDKVVNGHLSNCSEPTSLSAVQNMPQAIQSNLPPVVLEHFCKTNLSNSSLDPLNLPDLVGQHTNTDAQETICDFLTFAYMDEMDEVIHCSFLYGENDNEMGLSGDTFDGIANGYLHEDILEEPVTVIDDIYASPTVLGTLFGFPVDCELLTGLETCFQEENENISWDLCEPNYCGRVSPTYLCSKEDLISGFDPLPWEYSGCFDEGNHEVPPQDVVPSTFEQSDDVNSCTIHSSMSSLTSLVKNAASCPTLSLSEEAAREPAPSTHGLMSFFIGVDDFHQSIAPTLSNKSGKSLLTEQKKQKKHSNGPSEKSVKQTAVSKKARANNSCKPRPRDRQLIQDRLKELRDLVPKSEKCSIDSLLDKAIKHMQFLTNVTEQAQKLRYDVDKEILTGERLIESNSQQNGASSAAQDLKLNPVTVKDLPRPGSMLIEMICNEEDLFFEITKAISHLQLTILKSIMETNPGNSTSAKFIVEAPRGFSKMEIFFPLMQLLQRRRNTMMPAVV